jgi:release factor glutamine methyltransferase
MNRRIEFAIDCADCLVTLFGVFLAKRRNNDMVIIRKHPFAERKRKPMLEAVDLIFVGIIVDVHDFVYVIHIVMATSSFALVHCMHYPSSHGRSLKDEQRRQSPLHHKFSRSASPKLLRPRLDKQRPFTATPNGEGTELNIRNTLQQASAALTVVSDTPRLDAELLMAHALGISRESLLLGEMSNEAPACFAPLLARRLTHEPLAYITGARDFWTISLTVTRAVLIPRPDSETLIEAALAHFGEAGPESILDLGTGSGALLLAAMSEWPSAHGLGVDASPEALEVAKGNAEALGLSAEFRLGNWTDGIVERFDLILCNPPYVETCATLSPEVLNEPHAALFAGADGLDDYRCIIPQLPALLTQNGAAILEIGSTQAQAVSELADAAGFSVTIHQDLGGRDRCLLLQRST